jgi:hypothetical protein
VEEVSSEKNEIDLGASSQDSVIDLKFIIGVMKTSVQLWGLFLHSPGFFNEKTSPK